MGAHFQALKVGVLLALLDSMYTQVGFNLISVQVCHLLFFRIAQEEESARVGADQEIQEELRLLGVREKVSILDQENRQEAVVLLVRYHIGLPQHQLSHSRALRPTQMAHRFFT